MKEHFIQNEIRKNVNDLAVIFRINVGVFKSEDGRFVSTGVPKGFSDLFGFRKSDGKAIFLEIKNEKGKASSDQVHFLKTMAKFGAITGIARSVEEARNIIIKG